MNENHPPDPAAISHDLLTIAAVAVTVYALSSVLHEGVGHGGACLAVGGAPRLLSSMDFRCDLDGLAPAAGRVVAAGGTIAQLVVGLAAYKAYRALTRRSLHSANAVWPYALWLFAAVNLMQGTGYFLFSGVGGIGDWADVIAGLHPAVVWRVVLAVAGGALYWATTLRLFRALAPFLGTAPPERYLSARTLGLEPYVVGAALSLAAGLRNPAGVALIAISGAAASLGGTSGLAWGPQFLRGRATPAGAPAQPAAVRRSWPSIMLAIVVATAFVAVLGPGVHFG